MIEVQCGSKDALGQLFRRYARVVRSIACRIVGDEGEADDLVQEVFPFIFQKASLYGSARGKAAPSIIHMAYQRALDRRRYLKTRKFYSERDLDESRVVHIRNSMNDARFHDQAVKAVFGREVLARLTSYLSPEQHETIQLFFFEGFTLREIAEASGRSIVMVRSHYYRGLERLRKFILTNKMVARRAE